MKDVTITIKDEYGVLVEQHSYPATHAPITVLDPTLTWNNFLGKCKIEGIKEEEIDTMTSNHYDKHVHRFTVECCLPDNSRRLIFVYEETTIKI